ncbi:MAG: peptidylprolyl isomerase [Phycisphaerae bacterium]|nr:peptidylprolyl isomerase [Phycisphaerae bacterium]
MALTLRGRTCLAGLVLLGLSGGGSLGQSESAPAEMLPAATSAPARAEPAPLASLPALVDADLRFDRATLPVGSQVMVEFVLRNKTLEPIVLAVPGADPSRQPFEGMGLPLEHIFSGDRFRAVRIAAEGNPNLGDRVAMKPEYPVPMITLAPLSSVGLKFDLARFYPVLHQAGRYTIQWLPYAGTLSSAPVTIDVVNYQDVVLETTQGKLRLHLLYDAAPETVANFLELVTSRFYDGKPFHRIEPSFVAMAGCPLGNGTGRRPDGRTIRPEFSDTAFDVGTVGMSLMPGDPNSASCQFFIALARLPSLDGKYTAFARIEGPESLETLRKIAAVATDANGRPVEPVLIRTAVAVDAPTLR